jgi:hypothetical protein
MLRRMEKTSIKRPWKFNEAVVDACRKVSIIALEIEEIMMSLQLTIVSRT